MFCAYFLFLVVLFLCIPNYAHAILPPDIILNIGYQFVHFFSVIALVVGGVTGSVVIFLRTHVLFIQKYIYGIISTIVMIVIVSIGAIYLMQERENNNVYLDQIEALREQLQATRITISTSTPAFATSTDFNSDWGAVSDARKLFMSDTIYLFGDDDGAPIYVEIDLNRRQAPNGTFMHYYYLVGVYGDLEVSDYNFSYSSSTIPIVTKSIQHLEKIPFSDMSTREEYQGTIDFNGLPLSFKISGLQGDFITRNSPVYTRHQSVGVGTVLFNKKNIPVRVLVEGIHSSDFSKQIFFKGSENVVATTRQFILWDNAENFYLIDQSNVTSNTPEYPSHTWLLYKNAVSGYTKKGFTSDITGRSLLGQPETSWSITAPDFENAVIELSLVKYIDDGDSQKRMRALVEGKITDNNGSRDISGLGLIIE